MSTINKSELLQLLSNHLEHFHSIPPLTAKILAFLIMDVDSNGVSFDDLVQEFQASKSSISFSVNQLLEMDKIDFVYHDCNRKRFFRPNPNHFVNRLNEISENIEKDCLFFEKIYQYKKENSEKRNGNMNIAEVYKNFMEKQKLLIKETLKELENNTN